MHKSESLRNTNGMRFTLKLARRSVIERIFYSSARLHQCRGESKPGARRNSPGAAPSRSSIRSIRCPVAGARQGQRFVDSGMARQ